jgi:hypothetical protein
LSVGQGGTGATTLASNNVLLGNGTSAVQAVAPGTTGNVLTSNGTTWTSAAANAGAMTLIETKTLSAAAAGTIVFSGISASFKTVVLILHNIIFSSTTRAALRIGTGAGPTIQTSDYRYGGLIRTDGGNQVVLEATSGSSFLIGNPNTSTNGFTAVIYFSNLQGQNSQVPTIQGHFQTATDSGFTGGRWNTSGTPVTAISLIETADGTLTATGTVSLYGITS